MIILIGFSYWNRVPGVLRLPDLYFLCAVPGAFFFEHQDVLLLL
jgi:hypothetical protein